MQKKSIDTILSELKRNDLEAYILVYKLIYEFNTTNNPDKVSMMKALLRGLTINIRG